MTHPDPAPGVNVPLLAAPCGCTYKGRFYSTRACTTLDQDTATGRQRVWHAMAAQAFAEPVEQPTISDRGSQHMDPIADRDGGQIETCESSLATSPHIRVRIRSPKLPDRPEFQTVMAGMVEAGVHLPLADAVRLRDQITYLIEHHYQREDPMPQPQPQTETRWFDDADQVLAFGGLLVAAGEFDTAKSLLDYIEKPWKWDRERDQWIAHGRPNAEDNPEQWQQFVELLA